MSGLSYMKLVNFKENSQPQLLLVYVDDWNDMYEKWLEASHWSTFGEIYEGSWEEAVSQNQATKELLGL